MSDREYPETTPDPLIIPDYLALFSVAQCAARSGASQGYWRKEIRRRGIPIVRIGRLVKISRAAFDKWLAERTEAAE